MMLKAKVSVMPGHILSVYVQNIAKLYSALLARAESEDDWDTVESLDNLMLSKLPEFERADHLEAQERVSFDPNCIHELPSSTIHFVKIMHV